MPWGDLGLAVILLTVIVKLALYPLTKKSIESQVAMTKLQPELERIKKEFPNKEDQAKKTMELYKSQNSNPFSGCLVMIIQLPIIFALYYVFYQGLGDTTTLLYSFVKAPEHLNTVFLGLIDVSKPHMILAVLAALSQFVQMRVSFGSQPKSTDPNAKPDMTKTMQTQMQYVLPVMILVIGVKLSGAVALYWITSNIVGAVQEYRIRKGLGLAPKLI